MYIYLLLDKIFFYNTIVGNWIIINLIVPINPKLWWSVVEIFSMKYRGSNGVHLWELSAKTKMLIDQHPSYFRSTYAIDNKSKTKKKQCSCMFSEKHKYICIRKKISFHAFQLLCDLLKNICFHIIDSRRSWWNCYFWWQYLHTCYYRKSKENHEFLCCFILRVSYVLYFCVISICKFETFELIFARDM